MERMIEFQFGAGRMRLEAVMPGVIRCVHTMEERIAPPGMILDESRVPEEREDFCSIDRDEEAIMVRAGNLLARWQRSDGLLTWSEAESGKILLREGTHSLEAVDVMRYTTGGEAPAVERVKTVDGERSFIRNLKAVRDRRAWQAALRFRFTPEEGIFGFGQGEEGIWNHRGRTEYLYQHNMRIPMPFFLSDRGYGFLADCGSLMTFEDGPEEASLILDTVPQLDYYVIIGDETRQANRYDAVIDALRRLTGRAPLLPKWAFGYIQSKERYRTAEELAGVVRRYRELGVPLDGVVQDWLTWKEGEWGNKHVDPSRFGDLKERLEEIHALHAHAMVSVWPNMNQGTEDWQEFFEAGQLLNDLSTYNAFDPEARAVYWRQAKAELFDGGFDAWWCDSTEPFTGPDWNGGEKRPERERFELVGQEHKRFLDPAQANLYAVAHARGIYENQRQETGKRRVLNLTRSGYVSSQRYGALLWSGDISARWDVMRRQIAEALSMAACGYPWWTLDIGGFFVVRDNWQSRGCGCHTDPSPKWFWQGDFEEGIRDPGYRELVVRWMQFGCFLPVFRSHGTDTPREIWHFGRRGEPWFDAVESAIRLRYRLMPYLYSLAGEVWLNNGMMFRPLLFDFPGDQQAVRNDHEFMLGPSLLVCPVTEPMEYGPGGKALHRDHSWNCYLPAGTDWYDFRDFTRYAGGQTVTVTAPLDSMPVFVRAGSLLPLASGLQYADQPLAEPPELLVFSGADAAFDLYQDAGDGYAYEQGDYTLTRMEWKDAEKQLSGADGFRVRIIG